jgi:hypothetical protein
MALFKASPERQIVTATAARDKLAERLAAAERAVTDHRKAAEALALEGAPDEKLDATEAQMRASIDRAATLKAALAQSVIVVANLEKERDEAADRALREKTSVEVEALARRMHEGCGKLVADAKTLAEWATRSAAVVPESGGLVHLCAVIGNEIPAASDLIAKLLRVHAQAVLDGRAAPSLPQPPQPFIEVLPPLREPTAQLFCLRSIKFVDDTGQQRFVGQHRDASVPQRLVARALRAGCCVTVDDPRRAKLHTQGDTTQHPDGAFDLDAEEERQAAPILASPPELTVIDRGKGFTLKVARDNSL